MRLSRRGFGLGVAALAIGPRYARAADSVTVYAAASLTDVLQAIAKPFEAATGTKVVLSFAGSSVLAKQIEAGAEADLFIAADRDWVSYLDTRSLLEPGTTADLLGNSLVLVVPGTAAQIVDFDQPDWLAKLPEGRIALADPAHVPAGKYAKQALTKLGVWDKVEPRLALTDNVRGALTLVQRGEAVAGIVYATDVGAAKDVAVATAIPDSLHEPIVYPMAVLKGRNSPSAQRLADFLKSKEARAAFTAAGFKVL